MELYRTERRNSVAAATESRMKDIYPMLHKCSFFDGIPEDKYPNVLNCLKAVRREFPRGSSVLNIGDSSHPAGLVLKGSLEISMLDENGSQINVKHVPAGGVFGMAMACAGKTLSPVRLAALSDCELLLLDFTAILEPDTSDCPYRSRVSANLVRDMARQTLFLNQRLRIIGQKRLRSKIKIFLQCQHIGPDGTVHIPFKRSELADYLYSDRSALSRELGRMAQEGILEYSGQNIRILNMDFLKT